MCEKWLKEKVRMCVSFLSFPHVVCIKEQDRGKLLFCHFWQVCYEETHYIKVVVLEKSEIGVLPSKFMRKVRELGNLEEIFLRNFSFIETLLNDGTGPQEYTFFLLFIQIFYKPGFEKGI